jgi:hypothetical protein
MTHDYLTIFDITPDDFLQPGVVQDKKAAIIFKLHRIGYTVREIKDFFGYAHEQAVYSAIEKHRKNISIGRLHNVEKLLT